jgi:hypothetical protein
MKWNKKGSIENVPTWAMLMVVSVAIVAIGGAVVSGIGSTQTAGSLAYNVTQSGGQGLGNLSGQFPLIGTIMGFAVVLGLVMATLYFRAK